MKTPPQNLKCLSSVQQVPLILPITLLQLIMLLRLLNQNQQLLQELPLLLHLPTLLVLLLLPHLLEVLLRLLPHHQLLEEDYPRLLLHQKEQASLHLLHSHQEQVPQ
jgi:hypothetical protein